MSGTRVLIAGCGRMGGVRAAAARRLGATVAGVLDPQADSAAALARRCPGSRVLDPAADVDWDEFDAAFVCTPPGARGLELEAVRAGVPVLMEKPLGVSADRARPLVDAAVKQGARTAVGYMNRYRPAVRRLRAELHGVGAFALTCHWVASRYGKPWWSDPAASGGPLNDFATHLVDLSRFVCGEIETVCAFERARGRGDVVAVALRFHSGACGTLLHSVLAGDKHIALEVFSQDGARRLEGWDFHLPGTLSGERRDDVFLEETAAFLGGRPVLSDVGDAWRTQLAIDAIKVSAATGQPVEVPT